MLESIFEPRLNGRWNRGNRLKISPKDKEIVHSDSQMMSGVSDQRLAILGVYRSMRPGLVRPALREPITEQSASMQQPLGILQLMHDKVFEYGLDGSLQAEEENELKWNPYRSGSLSGLWQRCPQHGRQNAVNTKQVNTFDQAI